MFNDGPLFIGLAQLAEAGEWGALLAHPYHPLYPLAVRAAHAFVPDWEAAAAGVSLLSGGLAVAALFVFLRDAFDRSVATVGALLLAIHPFAVTFSADVQSDGLYLALFLAAVATLWRALRSGRARDAALAGALAGLAYGVRPEGVGVLMVGAALGALSGRSGARRALVWTAALAAGGLLVMSPYLAVLRVQTGEWVLTRKKSAAALGRFEGEGGGLASPGAEVDPLLLAAHPFLETVLRGPRVPPHAAPQAPPPVGSARRHARALRELYLASISTLRFDLAPLLLIGALSPRRRPGFRGRFVLGFVLLYLAVLYSLAFGAGYVSRRHALPPVALTLGYVALGATRVGGWIAAAARLASRPPWLAAALGAALAVAISAPKALAPRRTGERAERLAAEWLRDRAPPRAALAASRLRIAFYADAPYVPLPPDGAGPPLAYLQAAGARYMIVDEAILEARAALREAARDAMRVVYRTEAGGERVAVFAIGQAH
jgi:4-amino-4-deoxy-L-arabinose transferase-like glycosyltransferase